MFDMLPGFVLTTLNVMATLLVLAIGVGILVVLILYVIDRTQTSHAIRRNYPVIGRLRYFFEHMGEFFRQYFFAMDREELPFNRAQRSWAYRAAKNVDNTAAFGSTRDLRPVGTPMFVACPFPTLDEDAIEPAPVTIGPYCEKPYTQDRIFNISGMSYGALSRVAVKSLSRGAKIARLLVQYRRGRPVRISSGGRLRHRLSDRHGEIRLPQGGRHVLGGQARRDRRP